MFRVKKDDLHGAFVRSTGERGVFKMWIEVLLFGLLAVCAVFDAVRKEIPLAVVWCGMAWAILLHLKGDLGGMTWPAVLLSLLPGMTFWGISRVTKEKVGYGDGWVLMMIGLFTGLGGCFMILLVGLMLESAVVLVLLAAGKISMDRTVPFAPFLLLGMGVVVWL